MEGAGEDKEAAKKPTDKVSACGSEKNYKSLAFADFPRWPDRRGSRQQ